MPRVFPVILKRTTVIQGGSGPNPTDAFALAMRFADANLTLADAALFAFGFPDLIGALADGLGLGMIFPDSNPAVADLLKSLGLGFTDTNPALSDSLNLGMGFTEINTAPVDAAGLGLLYADTVAAMTDALLKLGLGYAETNAAPTDGVTYGLNAAYGDSNAAATDQLALSVKGLGDTGVAPTDARTSLARFWLSASAFGGTSSSTNVGNANGPNDGLFAALIETVATGTNPITLTSTCGGGISAATLFATAIYRGWFKTTGAAAADSLTIKMHSTSALFSDVTMVTISAANVDHTSGDFTFDLVAAGIDTLAKLQSCQVIHTLTNAVAGVGMQASVDAGAIETTGVI